MCRHRATVTLALPDNYDRQAFLDFHRRDPQAVAEQVDTRSCRKAFILRHHPALLTVDFAPSGTVNLTLECDSVDVSEELPLSSLAEHWLGLSQPCAEFEQRASNHPQAGPLIRAQAGLRVPQSATPFEALSWAIIGQQISVAAAVSIRRRFILKADHQHTCGLYCYPDPVAVQTLDMAALRDCGLSRSKAECLLTVARACRQQALLPEPGLSEPQLAALRARLLAIHGLGPWSVHYALLRGYAYMDGSLHGDVAVRRGIQRLQQMPAPPTAREADVWLSEFRPWRSLMAAHLWQSVSVNA